MARQALEEPRGRGYDSNFQAEALVFRLRREWRVRLTAGRAARSIWSWRPPASSPCRVHLRPRRIDYRWGVHVDDHLRTTVPNVYAAGDVAEAADWSTGERYVHAIFPNAVAQAKIAAANLGANITDDGAESMNSLKHLGVPIVAMGMTEGSR